jgi:hypothetical protein
LSLVELDDLAGGVLARKIVREGLAGGAPFGELGAALGDDVVFVLLSNFPSKPCQAGVTELFRKQDVEELVTFMRHFFEAESAHRLPSPLYIEDAREQRELMEAQLREWGISVDTFSNADDAWLAFLRT